MVWIHGIAEADLDYQNPSNPEKLRLLGQRLRLAPGQRLLDLGAGRGGPAVLFASTFGCRVTCVEWFGDFVEAGRRRADEAGVGELVEYIQGDASKHEVEPGYDVTMCLGATFIFGGLDGTLDRLLTGVRELGHVVVGECYSREEGASDDLAAVCDRFETRGLAVVHVSRASQDDWDRYVSGRTRGVQDWLDANPDHPQTAEFRAFRLGEYRQDFAGSPYVGWAIVAGRRTQAG